MTEFFREIQYFKLCFITFFSVLLMEIMQEVAHSVGYTSDFPQANPGLDTPVKW